MSFSATACYSLSTHTVKFNQTGVDVILNSTSQKVDSATYASGFACKVENGDFCFGKITFTTSFSVVISLADPKGGFDFQKSPVPKIFGSDEFDNPSVTKHEWAIDSCPVEFSRSGDDVTVKCPCDDTNTPCSNTCYSST